MLENHVLTFSLEERLRVSSWQLLQFRTDIDIFSNCPFHVGIDHFVHIMYIYIPRPFLITSRRVPFTCISESDHGRCLGITVYRKLSIVPR